MRGKIKDFALATLTYSGVFAMYTVPLVAVLAAPDREVITSVHTDSPIRKAVFHLPEPEPVMVTAEIVEEATEESINLDNTDHNKLLSENINLPSLEIASENINLEAPPPSTSQAKIAKKPKKRRRRNRYRNCRDNEGIAATDMGYAVNRDVVDSYAHITRYRELGHVSWHKDDAGERTGFKLRRINCDLREAGIRNGDIVTSVNGRTIQSIPEAIRMWFKVRRKNRVVLEITRRGQPITISYELT